MSNEYRNLEDLITNESFITWVLNPSADSTEYWDLYRNENDDKSRLVQEASLIIKELNAAKTLPSKDQKTQLLESIVASIDSKHTVKQRKIYRSIIAKVAALFVIAIGAYFLFETNGDNQFSTKYNEMQTINLPDGSTVVMNSNSSLKYSGDWKNEVEREIWLSGEAYFNVNKSEIIKSKKFIVHTDDLNVTVLGTQFNVNTHAGRTNVVLEEGKIDIELTKANSTADQHTFSMMPGQKTSYSPILKKHQISEVNTAVYTSWKDGSLVFDGTPISELKKIIENNYGYQVAFGNEALLLKKLDGKIDNPNLETLLNTLETIFNLQIERKDKRIIITE